MTDHIFAPFRPTESFEHTEHRRAREQRIVRRNIGSSLYDDFGRNAHVRLSHFTRLE